MRRSDCSLVYSCPTRQGGCRTNTPQGRRVNALAAYEPLAAEPWLGSCALERTLTSADVLAYLRALPAATVPRVVVLDNAGIHTSKEIKAERLALCREGIYLYYLPAYSPELNEI